MKNYNLSQGEFKIKSGYTKAILNNVTGLFIRLALLLTAALILSMTSNAQKQFNNVDANGVILDG